MKCPQCRSEMESRRENHRYVESGLPNIVLLDIEKRRCLNCGETTVSIPRPLPLHKAIAMAIIRQPSRLTPQEIRFLRKWLGLSGSDFAKRMAVDAATVSRWEKADDPQQMGPVAERLLRMFVAYLAPQRDYIDELAALTERDVEPPLLRFRVSSGSWESTGLTA